FKCCAVLGAFWSLKDLRKRMEEGQDLELMGKGQEKNVSTPASQDHFMWVFDIKSWEGAEKLFNEITLEGVAEKITCPLLVIHGENDRQIPLAHAEKTIEAAVNSPQKELKVFTQAEGGVEHCQCDNRTLGVDYMADWIAEILGGDPKGIL
ncbi:MAG: alpha/beta hydrolase, partial [Proteobacteria bacterium]|nr:alpha/beta hydrolase [Pseudomonadota bacterium]